MTPMAKTLLLAGSCMLCCACVSHQARVTLSSPAGETVHLYQDGRQLEGDTASFKRALPGEMHVNAWYRDREGHLYRAHDVLLSPRPWWQRFPMDLGSDLLWPRELVVPVERRLQFERVEELEPDYLDAVADAHGYAAAE